MLATRPHTHEHFEHVRPNGVTCTYGFCSHPDQVQTPEHGGGARRTSTDQQQQQQESQGCILRARSLLSELLKEGTLQELVQCERMEVDTDDEYEEDDDDYGIADDDFEAQLEAAEQFWASEETFSEVPRTSSITTCSERSSVASEPIAIPATSYFKSEVQRAALTKLNEKRKWYAKQQQLEAERLVAKSTCLPSSKARSQALQQQMRQPHLSYHRHRAA